MMLSRDLAVKITSDLISMVGIGLFSFSTKFKTMRNENRRAENIRGIEFQILCDLAVKAGNPSQRRATPPAQPNVHL